jgi:hypothetical protein
MKNNLLLEIRRVHEIMGVSTKVLIQEHVTAVKLIRDIISSFGDNPVRSFIKNSKNYVKQTSDDLLEKFKLGTITDDELKLFLKNIRWDDFIKKYLTNPDLFGSMFVDTIEKYYQGVIKNPSKYNEVITKLNSIIDDRTYFPEMPLMIKNAIKRQIKSKMDDALNKSSSNKGTKPIGKTIKGGKTINWVDVFIKGFKEGWSAPGILRSVLNWNTFMPKQNAKGWELALKWFFFGTTRSIPKGFKEIYSALRKKGASEDFAKILATKIISVPAEVFARWVIINGVIFVFNLIVAYVRENGGDENDKRKNGELATIAWRDIQTHWGELGPSWVWPVATVWGPIVEIVEGIFRRETPEEVYDKVKLGELPEQKEKEKLDSVIENTGNNENINKSNDIENFKEFLKSSWGGAYDETKYEITSDNKYYTVKDKQTNDSWYYEKNNDTFKYVAEPTNN